MFIPDSDLIVQSKPLAKRYAPKVDTRRYTADKFRKFDSAEPHIWRMFERFSLQAASKRDRFSARAVFQRIRWETEITNGEQFKVDDGFISHYARKFMNEHPEHKGFFETRVREGGYHV